MNDQQNLERELAAWMEAESADSTPDQTLDDILTATSRKRPLPRWLALIKEPPMRIASNVAIGSPSVRVAAITVATLLLAVLLAGAGIAGSRLLAADGAIIVDGSGGGDFTTIADAVAAAVDGDEILVRPGRYVETVTIDKDITLRGDSEDPSKVVIQIPEEAPLVPGGVRCGMGCDNLGDPMPYGIYLADVTDGVFADLTVERPPEHVAVVVHGGAPLIENVVLDIPGPPEASDFGRPRAGLWIDHASEAQVTGVTHEGWLTVDGGSAPVLEQNELIDTCIAIWGEATSAVFRDNGIRACPNGFSFHIAHGATPTIEGNDIRGGIDGGLSIFVAADGGGGTHAHIRGNTITGAIEPAIQVERITSATIEDNTLVDNRTAIRIWLGEAVVNGNRVASGTHGVELMSAASATVEGNDIRGTSGIGLRVGGNTVAVVSGNTICDNGTNVAIGPDAQATLEDNEICEDATAEPSE